MNNNSETIPEQKASFVKQKTARAFVKHKPIVRARSTKQTHTSLQTDKDSQLASSSKDATPPNSTNIDTGSKLDEWQIKQEYSQIRRYDQICNNEDQKQLIDNLQDFIEEYRMSDCDKFWQRKSGKVVLAVLMVKFQQNKIEFFRGINSEISLPSGSNCAERAAITAALSTHLEIRRSHFLSIAAVDPVGGLNPINPCGVCDEWLKKIQEESPSFTVLSFKSADLTEVIERCPMIFIEHHSLLKKPEALRSAWKCRCGFQFNDPRAACCTRCSESRYKFRFKLCKNRQKVIRSIGQMNDAVLDPQEWVHRLSTLSQLSIPTTKRTLQDLRSLKFIEEKESTSDVVKSESTEFECQKDQIDETEESLTGLPSFDYPTYTGPETFNVKRNMRHQKWDKEDACSQVQTSQIADPIYDYCPDIAKVDDLDSKRPEPFIKSSSNDESNARRTDVDRFEAKAFESSVNLPAPSEIMAQESQSKELVAESTTNTEQHCQRPVWRRHKRRMYRHVDRSLVFSKQQKRQKRLNDRCERLVVTELGKDFEQSIQRSAM